MRKFLPILYVLITFIIANPEISVYAIANVRVENVSFQCSPWKMGYVIVATGNIYDEPAGWDYLSYVVHDAKGNVIIWDTFGIGITGGEFVQDFNFLSEHAFTTEPEANPITFSFFEATSHGNFGAFLGSASFISPCIENQTIDHEQAAGIERLFQDGMVIARQPDGGLDFYMPDGCLMGKASVDILHGANLGDRDIIHSIAGCNGYRADIWSLGYPACQLQVNMYGPSGYEKVYTMERNTLHPTCIPAPNDPKPQPSTNNEQILDTIIEDSSDTPMPTNNNDFFAMLNYAVESFNNGMLVFSLNILNSTFGQLYGAYSEFQLLFRAIDITQITRNRDSFVDFIECVYNDYEGNEWRRSREYIDSALRVACDPDLVAITGEIINDPTCSARMTWNSASPAVKQSDAFYNAMIVELGSIINLIEPDRLFFEDVCK